MGCKQCCIVFFKLTKLYTETEEKLEETTKNLTVTTENLITTTENLHETKCELKVTVQDRDEQKFLVKTHVSTETCLFGEAKEVGRLLSYEVAFGCMSLF